MADFVQLAFVIGKIPFQFEAAGTSTGTFGVFTVLAVSPFALQAELQS